MVIETEVKRVECKDTVDVCIFLNENKLIIHKVLSITPNLHSNAYLIFFEQYTEKEFKVMEKKTLKAIKARYKKKQLKKNKP